MAMVEGGTLAQELAGGPMSTRRAAQLTETLARAIHYAHERGIIHRDLKPANVLLTPEGVPKIADFGLAKHLGKRLGSDPERHDPGFSLLHVAGASDRERPGAGPATDVYSLGAILYEMLAGAPPFRAETPARHAAQTR